MPMRRSFRSTGARPGFRPRRRYEWFSSAANQDVTGPTGTGQTVLLNQTDLTDLTEPTLKRVRGNLLLSVAPLSSEVTFALGLMIVQLDELGNPPAVNAWDQDQASWLWYHFGTLIDFGGGHRYYRVEVDSKSQRRVESEEGLVLFSQAFNGTGQVFINFQGRYLFEQV